MKLGKDNKRKNRKKKKYCKFPNIKVICLIDYLIFKYKQAYQFLLETCLANISCSQNKRSLCDWLIFRGYGLTVTVGAHRLLKRNFLNDLEQFVMVWHPPTKQSVLTKFIKEFPQMDLLKSAPTYFIF